MISTSDYREEYSMKTTKAVSKYAVSFNCAFGEYICGDECVYSLDYAGDDIESLAAEVCAGDPNYPMAFVRVGEDGDDLIGFFHHIDEDPEDCHDAVMVRYDMI
jgi:hypothetical protein